MGIESIDHLYVETSDWEASVAFWTGLGFEFVEQWGSEGHRAGRLDSAAAAVVLAEVTDRAPELNVFFALSDAAAFAPAAGVDVIMPLHDTHWGTRMIRVRDPEGRVHALEEAT
jgi:catechol 2,3-dioxygenase-like lactoylglutathione lyase family enzyme